jgi:hypothetical protein
LSAPQAQLTLKTPQHSWRWEKMLNQHSSRGKLHG